MYYKFAFFLCWVFPAMTPASLCTSRSLPPTKYLFTQELPPDLCEESGGVRKRRRSAWELEENIHIHTVLCIHTKSHSVDSHIQETVEMYTNTNMWGENHIHETDIHAKPQMLLTQSELMTKTWVLQRKKFISGVVRHPCRSAGRVDGMLRLGAHVASKDALMIKIIAAHAEKRDAKTHKDTTRWH